MFNYLGKHTIPSLRPGHAARKASKSALRAAYKTAEKQALAKGATEEQAHAAGVAAYDALLKS
jgi:hypothetical protein